MRALSGLRRRLCAQKGFTLTEMLATLVIMVLASMLLASGIPSAQHAYMGAVDASNAEVSLSTVINRLRDELCVADGSSVTAGSSPTSSSEASVNLISFTSKETGNLTVIQQRVDGIYVMETYAGSYSGAPSIERRLVPHSLEKGANSTEFVVRFASGGGITYDQSTRVFTVTGLEVVRKDEQHALAKLQKPLTVRPIAASSVSST